MTSFALRVASPPAGATSSSVRVLDTSSTGTVSNAGIRQQQHALRERPQSIVFASSSTIRCPRARAAPHVYAKDSRSPACHPRLREHDRQQPPTAPARQRTYRCRRTAGRDVQLRQDQPVSSVTLGIDLDLYVKDLQTGDVRLCPRTPPAEGAGRRSRRTTRRARLLRGDDDGDTVVFASLATNLVPTHPSCRTHATEDRNLLLRDLCGRTWCRSGPRACSGRRPHEPRRASRRSTLSPQQLHSHLRCLPTILAPIPPDMAGTLRLLCTRGSRPRQPGSDAGRLPSGPPSPRRFGRRL